jgi:alkylation response protein AidB-like acyl-CoA dehydrogenase
MELATTKTPRAMDALLRDQPMIQSEVGRAEARLRSSRAFLREAVREIWDAVLATGAVTLEQRAVLRLATTDGIRAAVAVVDMVYTMAGATAAYESSPIQRHFQDVHVMSQHLQARLAHYELVGRHWLGLKIDESRL